MNNTGKCKYVCDGFIDRDRAEMGHITEHKGGKTILENLKSVCGCCNRSMGTNNMEEWKENILIIVFIISFYIYLIIIIVSI